MKIRKKKIFFFGGGGGASGWGSGRGGRVERFRVDVNGEVKLL